MPAQEIIDELFQLFLERGHRHYGEQVTETQHALQCATFARQAGEPAHLVAACLLHDYGHLLHNFGEQIADQGVDARHENIGANYLARYFAEDVVEPIRLHVRAKRYLCWKERAYLDDLSEASLKSLSLQGGPMSDEEARAFEAHPHFASAVSLRRYDDMGKVPDMATLSFEDFRSALEPFVRQPS
ncbi:MAG: HD domain-containing protein [Verrucomicrobia bacterium]|nr:HD domain-containing protein [Verrucomicrobiota bacterium]